MLIARALAVAAKAHSQDLRKGSDVPYIVHPVEVALILQENHLGEEIIAAGLLHDTLEDTSLTPADLENLFGPKILKLVLGASEELEGRKERCWEERKRHTIEYLKKEAPREVKYIACADKLSNIWSIIRDYQEVGEELWDRFLRKEKALSREEKRARLSWYYQGIVKSLAELEGLKMYAELKKAVEQAFKL